MKMNKTKHRKQKENIWQMFIYKMKLHDINEYFGIKLNTHTHTHTN